MDVMHHDVGCDINYKQLLYYIMMVPCAFFPGAMTWCLIAIGLGLKMNTKWVDSWALN